MDEKIQQEFNKIHTSIAEFGQAMILGFGKVYEELSVVKADVSALKTDVAELKTDVGVLKTDVGELKEGQTGLRNEIRGLHQRFDVLEKNLSPLGEEPMEATDLYGRVSYIENHLGIRSGKG